MLNTKRKRTKIDYGRVKKGKTIPDQSMSIHEIVRRFVRGLPTDIVRRDPVYVDQSEHDLEQLSRMEFGEKAAIADEMRANAERIIADADRQRKENLQRRKEEAEASKAPPKGERRTGIDPLDNTMPVDTSK